MRNISSQKQWDAGLSGLLCSNNVRSADDVYTVLTLIQTQLKTLMTFEPLPNKLLTIPQVFISKTLTDNITDVLSKVCRIVASRTRTKFFQNTLNKNGNSSRTQWNTINQRYFLKKKEATWFLYWIIINNFDKAHNDKSKYEKRFNYILKCHSCCISLNFFFFTFEYKCWWNFLYNFTAFMRSC